MKIGERKKKRYMLIAIVIIGMCCKLLTYAATCKVEYEGKAKQLVAVPSDFFSGFGRMMPGDQVTEEIKLSNTQGQPIKFFFYTKLEEELEKTLKKGYEVNEKDEIGRAAALLEKIQLTIDIKDKGGNITRLYAGDLAAASLSNPVDIGTYSSGYAGALIFTLDIPKKLNNVYASSWTDVIWVFRVDEEEDKNQSSTVASKHPQKHEKTKTTNPPKSQYVTTTSTVYEKDTRESSEPVILGIEGSQWILGIICMIGGLAGIVLLFIVKRRQK